MDVLLVRFNSLFSALIALAMVSPPAFGQSEEDQDAAPDEALRTCRDNNPNRLGRYHQYGRYYLLDVSFAS